MTRILALALCLTLLLAGAAQAAEVMPQPDIIIEDEGFIAAVNAVIDNYRDYLGQTLQLEGLLLNYTLGEPEVSYHMVYRVGPGCCDSDGSPGFEVAWPEGSAADYPESGAWVRALGRLESYEEAGRTMLRLRLLSLETLPEEGQVYVEK